MGGMENIEFKRENGRNYILLPRNPELEDYREKMLLSINLEHLLKIDIRNMDGVSNYYYDMMTAPSLKHIAAVRDLKGEEIRAVLMGITKLIDELNEYLLLPSQLILLPECVSISKDESTVKFCYYPQMDEETNTFMELAEFLMQHTDHSDEMARKLSYGYFGKASEGEINPKQLLELNNNSEGFSVYSQINETGFEEDEKSASVDAEKLHQFDEDFREYDNPGGQIKDVKKYNVIAGIALLLIIAESAAVGFLYINPAYTQGFGNSLKVIIGTGLFIFAVEICVIIYCMVLKIKQKETGQNDGLKEGLSSEFTGNNLKNTAEDFGEVNHTANDFGDDGKNYKPDDKSDYKSDYEEDDEGTVLLTEIMEKGNPVLTGKINDENIRIEINKNPFVIGASAQKADGVVRAVGISRIHAVIKGDGEVFNIIDMNSTNGTFVNGEILNGTKEVRLKNGDRLRFANTEFTFEAVPIIKKQEFMSI